VLVPERILDTVIVMAVIREFVLATDTESNDFVMFAGEVSGWLPSGRADTSEGVNLVAYSQVEVTLLKLSYRVAQIAIIPTKVTAYLFGVYGYNLAEVGVTPLIGLIAANLIYTSVSVVILTIVTLVGEDGVSVMGRDLRANYVT
jgi:hypothetical protein